MELSSLPRLTAERDAAYVAKTAIETERMRALEAGDVATFAALASRLTVASEAHCQAVDALETLRRASGLSRPRRTAKTSFADVCAARFAAKGSRGR